MYVQWSFGVCTHNRRHTCISVWVRAKPGTDLLLSENGIMNYGEVIMFVKSA